MEPLVVKKRKLLPWDQMPEETVSVEDELFGLVQKLLFQNAKLVREKQALRTINRTLMLKFLESKLDEEVEKDPADLKMLMKLDKINPEDSNNIEKITKIAEAVFKRITKDKPSNKKTNPATAPKKVPVIKEVRDDKVSGLTKAFSSNSLGDGPNDIIAGLTKAFSSNSLGDGPRNDNKMEDLTNNLRKKISLNKPPNKDVKIGPGDEEILEQMAYDEKYDVQLHLTPLESIINVTDKKETPSNGGHPVSQTVQIPGIILPNGKREVVSVQLHRQNNFSKLSNEEYNQLEKDLIRKNGNFIHELSTNVKAIQESTKKKLITDESRSLTLNYSTLKNHVNTEDIKSDRLFRILYWLPNKLAKVKIVEEFLMAVLALQGKYGGNGHIMRTMLDCETASQERFVTDHNEARTEEERQTVKLKMASSDAIWRSVTDFVRRRKGALGTFVRRLRLLVRTTLMAIDPANTEDQWKLEERANEELGNPKQYRKNITGTVQIEGVSVWFMTVGPIETRHWQLIDKKMLRRKLAESEEAGTGADIIQVKRKKLTDF